MQGPWDMRVAVTSRRYISNFNQIGKKLAAGEQKPYGFSKVSKLKNQKH